MQKWSRYADWPDWVYLLTPWSRGLPEKLTSYYLVTKFPKFYGTEDSLPDSQDSSTCPYLQPDRFSPHHFSKIYFNIILPTTPVSFQVVSFFQIFPADKGWSSSLRVKQSNKTPNRKNLIILRNSDKSGLLYLNCEQICCLTCLHKSSVLLSFTVWPVGPQRKVFIYIHSVSEF
jgi:hypothetical protein